MIKDKKESSSFILDEKFLLSWYRPDPRIMHMYRRGIDQKPAQAQKSQHS